jgi:hypothetical protein
MKKVYLFSSDLGYVYFFFFDNDYLYLKSLKYNGLFFTIPLNENFGDQSLSWYSGDYNDSIFDKFKNANEVSKTKYLFDEFNNISKLDIIEWYFENISSNILSTYNSLKLFANLYNREEKLNYILLNI